MAGYFPLFLGKEFLQNPDLNPALSLGIACGKGIQMLPKPLVDVLCHDALLLQHEMITRTNVGTSSQFLGERKARDG
jgi:hypothetical protein